MSKQKRLALLLGMILLILVILGAVFWRISLILMVAVIMPFYWTGWTVSLWYMIVVILTYLFFKNSKGVTNISRWTFSSVLAVFLVGFGGAFFYMLRSTEYGELGILVSFSFFIGWLFCGFLYISIGSIIGLLKDDD